MKYSAFIILFLLSTGSFAQVKAPETDFILKAGTVYWQHVYDVPGKSSTEILQLVEEKFPEGINRDHFVKNDKQASFQVHNDKPNIRKMGGKEAKTHTIALLYMKYQATIDIEDGKYTATLRNIFLDNKDATERKSGDISKFACNTSNLTFKTDPGILKGLIYLDMHLLEEFDIAAKPADPKK